MDLTKNSVLSQDIQRAAREFGAIHSCYGRIEKSLYEGNFKEAKLTARDLNNSIIELEKMHLKKLEYDRFLEVAKEVNTRTLQMVVDAR
ncbi:hypothetical protein [Peribacillus loiseleuriae]|uniref:LXG domain-containing protein n=1 Tax=Peribacillus loiseleuriae TaxID=1679170 RepID=A0A0K9GR82_9BACI|nr:hypothetical protein [Peribacillus loiseleuriae]KMY49204.1 hypothetical protein AC625_06440 [Peribacillus loiseleuriae]